MEHEEASLTIAAPAERLYDLISDLPRMGEWSPENCGGKWVKGATAPVVGARFRGRNRKGWRRWTTLVTVVIAEPAKEFAFDVTGGPWKVARWGYRFTPTDGATVVTEYWDDHRATLMAKITSIVVGVGDRPDYNRRGMEETLRRLAAVAEGRSA